MSTEQVTYIITLRDRVTRNLKRINKAFERTDKSAFALGEQVTRLAARIGALTVGKQILTLGSNMEQTRVAFATFLGDAEKANEVIAQMNKFANVTPFDNAQVIKSGRILLSAGINADHLQNRLKMVGDVASGANIPLNDMASIYAKAMNKGRVQAEELNQLAERGVPILQTFADMYGITTAEVMEMGSKGQLTSDQLTLAFERMTSEGGMFFNMMEKQSKTAGGMFSTVMGKMQTKAIELGEKALPTIKKMLDFVINNFDRLTNIVVLAVKAFATYKVTMFAINKITRILAVSNKILRISYVVLNRGLKSATKSMKLFNAATKANMIGLVITGITLLIPLVSKLFDSVGKLTLKQQTLNEVNKRAAQIHGQQASRIRTLQATIERGNISQKERADIINEINKNYGQYLPNLLKENATNEQIANALNRVNKQLLLKAKLQAVQEKINEESRKQLEWELKLANAAEIAEEATSGFWNNVKIMLTGGTSPGGQIASRLEKIANLYDDYNKKIRESEDKQKVLLDFQEKMRKSIKDLNLDIKKSPQYQQAIKTTGIVQMQPDPKAQKQISTITGAAPKTYNINIESLVEQFNVNTENLTEGSTEVKKAIVMALSEALTDVQPITD